MAVHEHEALGRDTEIGTRTNRLSGVSSTVTPASTLPTVSETSIFVNGTRLADGKGLEMGRWLFCLFSDRGGSCFLFSVPVPVPVPVPGPGFAAPDHPN